MCACFARHMFTIMDNMACNTTNIKEKGSGFVVQSCIYGSMFMHNGHR